MLGCGKNICHGLIRWFIDSCSCNISYDCNLSDKVDSETICADSCLSGGSNWTSHISIEWHPTKSSAPSKAFDKCWLWIVIDTRIGTADGCTTHDHPSGILTPSTSMYHAVLIGITENICRTDNLWSASCDSMTKCSPSNISKPKESRKVSCLIDGSYMSSIGGSDIKCHETWMSSGPCAFREEKSLNTKSSSCRKYRNKKCSRD